jgi:ADP-ribosylglycohydrolase
MLTHNDSAAIASAVAFVRLLWGLLGMRRTPARNWWPEVLIDALRDLEVDAIYEPRAEALAGFRGTLWQFLERELAFAEASGLSVLEACNRWQSGAYLLETLPCVVYILMRHGHDPEEAIIRAVNDTWDNDTAGAIVGAAVGALHGRQALPPRWVEGLSGVTIQSDTGRMFELIEQAGKAYGGDRR